MRISGIAGRHHLWTAALAVVAVVAGVVIASTSAGGPALGSAARPDRLALSSFDAGWNQPPASATLSGVSCPSGRFCLAVGSFADGLGHRRALAERWDGRRWRVLAGLKGSGLSGVSCLSATFCMAVGGLPQEWNGRSWRVASGLLTSPLRCAR